MRKLLVLLLLCALIAPVFAGGSKEDSLQTIKQRGTLVIATEGNWTPWTYHDASDTLTGFDVELGTLMAKSLGVQPEFHEVPWESILVGVEQGVFDVACNGVGYTAERAEKFSFSDPYLYTEAVLVVRSDNTTVHTLEDLKGKKTSNSPNSTYAQLAESYGATVDYVDTLGETMMMIEQGRVDATINAKGSVDSYLEEHPDAKIKVVQTVAGEPVCYPIRKGEQTQSLLEAINSFLKQARQDGTLSALSVKYFGTDLTKAN
ncbi:MAG: transporter substrate-binding domain-containing protein [Spirochaetales bacterium]|nr:transporter substrate-binding domain-containing protein [Spirochaetales bacterium]